MSGPYLAVESVTLSCVSNFGGMYSSKNYFEKIPLESSIL